MSSGKLQSILMIAVVSVILSPIQTSCANALPSLKDDPCKTQRKCPFNPILYHNYQECIVCSGRQLTTFPKGLDPHGNASAAELRENNLTAIHTSDFANFSRLSYLDLSVNDITTLHDGWAQNLSKLQYLYLSNNKLRSIRNATFIGLDPLQYLHLDGNLITVLPSHAFGRLPQLQVVHLQNNLLEVLEGDAFLGLEQLRKLNLGYNLLRTLSSDSFVGLEVLNELILSGNVFSEVPAFGLASLVGLQHIRMDSNDITTLPRNAFTNLTALIELTVALNNITTVQNDWCNGLGMLQYINISYNKVENLSEDIFESCPNIVILDFSYNHLQDVPASVFKPLQNHHAVDLRANILTTLSQLDILNDSTVTDMRLEGNPLQCDCHIHWLKVWMDSGRISRIMLSPNELFLKGRYAELNRASSLLDAKCNKPENLSGNFIRNVPRDNFTCSPSTPPTINLPSVVPDLQTNGHYPIVGTMKTSTMVPKSLPVMLSKFDLKMGIIVFLAVLSFTLMIILGLVAFPRPACRWREQIYFYISDPPLPARYQNVSHKGEAPSRSSVLSEMDDTTSLVLLDLKLNSQDNQVKTDLNQFSNSNPQDLSGKSELSRVSENQAEPDCNFCNGKSTISSTGGRHWSVIVHSPAQEHVRCLSDDDLQSSCNLHDHFGNCGPSTELERYHQTLKSEASASLAGGVILEHIRQCCSFHKSVPLCDTIPRIRKEEVTGMEQTRSDGQSLHNHPLQVHCSSIEDIRVKSPEEHDFHANDSSLIKFPGQKVSTTTQRLSSSVLPKAFVSTTTASSVAHQEDTCSNGKYPRLSYPVAKWTSLGCLQDSPNVTRKDLTSLTTTSTHRRSRSAREPRRLRKHKSSDAMPHRQRSWHGNRSLVLQQRVSCDNTQSYLKDQTSRHAPRPPAPLPRPEETLTNRKGTFQELIATQLTQKSCMDKNMTHSESEGHKNPFGEFEHAEESLYFEPME